MEDEELDIASEEVPTEAMEELPTEEREEPPRPLTKREERIKSAVLILRDVGVAFLVVFLVFMGMWVYSGVWPPIVVVESSSMQHDDFVSSVGVIDTGDLVLVDHMDSSSEIVTFTRGRCTGHSTYGDYGDVIIYNERGGGDKPIIHRALIYLKLNTTTGNSFDVPDLECSRWVYGENWWMTRTSTSGVESRDVDRTLTLNLGKSHRDFENVTLNVQTLLNEMLVDSNWTGGGFVAMGDNNPGPDSHFIKHGWVIGVARGEIPWFGLIKLSVTGEIPMGKVCTIANEKNCASQNSWSSLVIAIILLIVVPIVLDVGIGFYQKYKKRKELLSEEELEEPPPEEQPAEEVVEEVSEETEEEKDEELLET